MQKSPNSISYHLQLNWCRRSRQCQWEKITNLVLILSSSATLQSLAYFWCFMLTHIYSRQEKFILAMCMAWVPLGALLCMPCWTWWASLESRMAALQASWATVCCPWWSCPLLQSSSRYSKYRSIAPGVIYLYIWQYVRRLVLCKSWVGGKFWLPKL